MEPLPTNIGRYVIESLVGVGGMGQIYKAQDPDLRRTVAIKLISTKLMSGADRADYIKRFRREAEAAARCAHPNIVAVYDFALHEGQPFLAMEFVYGQSLRQILDAATLMAVPEAIGVMLQVLDALASAHKQGVIHQDIKPGNIMLAPENRVKVGDFGISRLMNVDTTTIFSTIGTPSYMSPEQCRGDDVDGRSDLFSAGATLFEMVSGERAFQGRNVTEVSHRIQNDSLPLLPAQVRAAAPRLQLVLERAMGKHPEDRFDTGVDMAEALRQVLGDAVPAAPDSTRHDRTRIAPDGGRPAVTSDPQTPREDAVARKPGLPLDPDLLKTVEDKLRVYVGPIARVLVHTVAGRGSSAADLCAELALSVPDEADRERFRREVAPLVRPRPPALTSTSSVGDSGGRAVLLPEPELERAQAALTEFVGPIARVLVRRAAANAPSVEALWQALSNHIEAPAERSAFLRRRPSWLERPRAVPSFLRRRRPAAVAWPFAQLTARRTMAGTTGVEATRWPIVATGRRAEMRGEFAHARAFIDKRPSNFLTNSSRRSCDNRDFPIQAVPHDRLPWWKYKRRDLHCGREAVVSGAGNYWAETATP